nr:serine/arginine-rich splicing factor RS2Z33-like [Drosophila takahashii]XP_044251101.1 serine/arginine-rich splicing factor RS2Z33-like [Drosophila takahashii]
MLSCIIEGITNQGLRNLAHIQSFVDVGHIKRAFADVRLPKSVGKPMTSLDFKDKKETRCFNCNAKGHWANECRKSKREKGSCYACGEMGHFVATCLKSKNKNTGNNNYNVS